MLTYHLWRASRLHIGTIPVFVYINDIVSVSNILCTMLITDATNEFIFGEHMKFIFNTNKTHYRILY